jgi:hypothetical protein
MDADDIKYLKNGQPVEVVAMFQDESYLVYPVINIGKRLISCRHKRFTVRRLFNKPPENKKKNKKEDS